MDHKLNVSAFTRRKKEALAFRRKAQKKMIYAIYARCTRNTTIHGIKQSQRGCRNRRSKHHWEQIRKRSDKFRTEAKIGCNLYYLGCCCGGRRGEWIVNTFAASYLNTQGLNNSCLKSPASTLFDLTFQSRALRSFSLNQLRNLSL